MQAPTFEVDATQRRGNTAGNKVVQLRVLVSNVGNADHGSPV